MSTRTVCTECERTMRPAYNGAYVIEHAAFGPYRIWFADLMECPECGTTIVTGFPARALSEHFQDDFSSTLTRALASSAVIHEFESPEQREAWSVQAAR